MTELDKRRGAIELLDQRLKELERSSCIRDMTMHEFLGYFRDELAWEAEDLEKGA